jgi:hypothetical protein
LNLPLTRGQTSTEKYMKNAEQKKQAVQRILSNPVYKANSRLYIDAEKHLLKLPLNALENLELVWNLKEEKEAQ